MKKKIFGLIYIVLVLAICFLIVSRLLHAREGQRGPAAAFRLQEQLNVPVQFMEDCYVRSKDEVDTAMLRRVPAYQQATLTGIGRNGEAEIVLNGIHYYASPALIASDARTMEKLAQKKNQELAAARQRLIDEQLHKEELEALEMKQMAEDESLMIQVMQPQFWDGSKLTAVGGVNYGPSGKETYYNLPMEGVISIMRSMGNNDPYWVREDGVKMLGDYIMVAAHLGVHPRGTLVPTSLGMGLVCDTGGFALDNPTQLDIATAW